MFFNSIAKQTDWWIKMSDKQKTIDTIAGILCKSVKKVLEANTLKKIDYSRTIQSIPKISIKPDIGCFIQVSGDYNGLLVFNFSGDAAVKIYRSYMLSMGMPEDELAMDFTSNEVIDSVGEIINQIMGELMRTIEDKYDLGAYSGQPKVLALNSSITLTIDADYRDNRRVSFNIENNRFQIEMAMEQTEFITIKES
jgi:CheY-specific phosphatase CheX